MPMQSPILIDPISVIPKHYQPYRFKNYNKPFSATLTNTSTSARIDFVSATPEELPSISGGGFFSEFLLTHMIFHWDAEHVIGETRYPLEVQLVHYSKQCGSENRPKEFRDGIAIISSFFGTCSQANPIFDKILAKIPESSKSFKLPVNLEEPVIPRPFLSPVIKKFYRYQGSLTDDKYEEVVTWTLFSHPGYISEEQMSQFRQMPSCQGGLQVNNFRELQNDRKRPVYISKI